MKHEAPQVEIATALPTRNWRAIRIKIYEIIGFRRFHISPKPICDAETYEDYLKRVERDGDKVANRTSGNRWRNDELEALEECLGSGATQLEIAAALPNRTWEAIRKKILKLRGPGLEVPEIGHLQNGETIADYLERNPEAGAMSLLISENCSRQITQIDERQRSGGSEANYPTARLSLSNLFVWDIHTTLSTLNNLSFG